MTGPWSLRASATCRFYGGTDGVPEYWHRNLRAAGVGVRAEEFTCYDFKQ
ncbi:hypothetical protein [Streptomyces sp. IMTB 2501]|nr:hypothetical protein [Streptomyces sp. IMTB 2501]